MKKISNYLLVLVIALIALQCKKNDSGTMTDPDPGVDYTKQDPVTTSIHGNIIDENGNSASGVAVKIGVQNVVTDADGHFFIGDAALDKNASLLVAEKPGYFKSFKSFAATQGVNYVRIKLIKKTLAATLDASAGGVATLANGSKITIQANSIADKTSGALYTGSIKLYAVPIDPTASDIAEIVPGSFMANDSAGKRVLLQSFGMMAIELESPSGSPLQIKTGSTAELNFSIPASLQGKAPTTLPLWYIDETTGLWKQDGNATKSGNSYIGTVKHFSFWNGDYPEKSIRFRARCMYTNSFFGPSGPIANILVEISGGGITLGGYTDNKGVVEGYIPKDIPLNLSVTNTSCHIVIFSTPIGPYSQDVDYGDIILDAGNYKLTTIEGRLLNCNGSIVKKGSAILHTGSLTFYAPVNDKGEYYLNYTRCSNAVALVNITGIDSVSKQQSKSFPLSVSPDADIIIMPDIKACGTSTAQYVNYTIDTTGYNYDDTNGNLYASKNSDISISAGFGSNNIQLPSLSFSFSDAAGTGVISLTSLFAYNTNRYVGAIAMQPLKGLLTGYAGTVGEFYEGSFSGEVQEVTGNLIPIPNSKHKFSCTFRVKRQ